jgi:ATP-dependent Lhr-like helicase
VLARRIEGYDASFLDQLCFAGRVAWTRLEAPGVTNAGGRSLRTSSIAVMPRELVATFVPSTVDESELSSGASAMLAHLRARGASFFADLKSATGLLPEPAEHALAELVSAGLVTSDGFAGLRALLLSAKDREKVRRRTRGRSGLVPGASLDAGGRWSVVPGAGVARDDGANADARAARKSGARTLEEEERAEAQARALLRRWGVVFRKLAERDGGLVPWRDILFALRRLEARGEVRGGRFVHGFAGEQFALPDVVTQLRAARKQSGDPRHVVISAADPMNLTGVVLPGARVPAVLGHRILYEDGMLVAVLDAQGVRVVDDTRLDMGEIDALLRRNPGRVRFTRAGSAAVRTPRVAPRKAES